MSAHPLSYLHFIFVGRSGVGLSMLIHTQRSVRILDTGKMYVTGTLTHASYSHSSHQSPSPSDISHGILRPLKVGDICPDFIVVMDHIHIPPLYAQCLDLSLPEGLKKIVWDWIAALINKYGRFTDIGFNTRWCGSNDKRDCGCIPGHPIFVVPTYCLEGIGNAVIPGWLWADDIHNGRKCANVSLHVVRDESSVAPTACNG